MLRSRQFAASGSALQPETIALLAAMTTAPNSSRVAAIDALIATLKTAGAWLLIDALWILAAHPDGNSATASQASLLNWKAPGTNSLSLVNAPTFSPNKGYNGDGATSYLNGPNLATFGGQFTQNSCHIGLYPTSNVSENASDIGNSNALIRARSTSTSISTRLNEVTTTATTGTGNTSICHVAVNRASAASYDVYKTGADLGTISVASTAIVSAAMQICAAAGSYSTKKIGAAHVGGALTATMIQAVSSALDRYMAAVGAV